MQNAASQQLGVPGVSQQDASTSAAAAAAAATAAAQQQVLTVYIETSYVTTSYTCTWFFEHIFCSELHTNTPPELGLSLSSSQ
jgi:hypothetical protein